MEITFTGAGPIKSGSIAIGDGADCAGDETGGTTFCTIGPTDIWEGFTTGPDSVDFLAQSASFDLTPGQEYFVNILFSGSSIGDPSFTGEFLTSFTPTPRHKRRCPNRVRWHYWAPPLSGSAWIGAGASSRASLRRIRGSFYREPRYSSSISGSPRSYFQERGIKSPNDPSHGS
jgi:hypothetical protein